MSKFRREQKDIRCDLDECKERLGRLEKAEKKESVMNPAANRERLTASYQEKLYSALEDLRNSEDLSVQIQTVARAIQYIDQLFAFYSENEDKYRKQLVLKLRGALKLHYTKALFTDRQINQLTDSAAYLERPSVGADEVWEVVTALEDIGLSTFPELPELGG